MATGKDRSQNCFPMMSSSMTQRPIKKQSRIAKRKFVKSNLNHTHFRFGGNRKDPLNLNALIRKKQQATQPATTTSSILNDDNSSNPNDRPVEILLQPDIFDPLCLDTSSRNDEPSNSTTTTTNLPFETKTHAFPIRKNHFMKKRRNLPPPRYGNFQGYYGYRQPNHDQRLQYLENDWFQNKQVLDVGCHTGHVTFYVAEHFQPAQIVGLDIDQQLIQQAQNQLTNRIQQTTNTTAESKRYPYNLRFQQGY